MSEPANSPEKLRILIVDDDAAFADALAHALNRRGHVAHCLASPGEALDWVRRHGCEALILDLRLGPDSGLRYIAPLRAAHPELRILLLTGYASIATAVEAIKLGANHYLPKPARVEDILAALVGKAGNDAIPLADAPLTVGRLEWEHLQKVLHAHNGNLSATARALKMHRRTLQRKLAKRPAKD